MSQNLGFTCPIIRDSFAAAPNPIAHVNAVVLHSILLYGLAVGAMGIGLEILKALTWEKKRKQRKKFYSDVYLLSDDWKRKRYVVLKRDNWTCVYCGQQASQVHHQRYARRNIGKEPIEWLVSTCGECHKKQHL